MIATTKCCINNQLDSYHKTLYGGKLIMDTILEILETIKPGTDFTSSTDFIEEHLLESMEILQLVSELNDEFDINITLPYIKPENFKSVENIYNMVQEILEDE